VTPPEGIPTTIRDQSSAFPVPISRGRPGRLRSRFRGVIVDHQVEVEMSTRSGLDRRSAEFMWALGRIFSAEIWLGRKWRA
jgi:hypothetical protein